MKNQKTQMLENNSQEFTNSKLTTYDIAQLKKVNAEGQDKTKKHLFHCFINPMNFTRMEKLGADLANNFNFEVYKAFDISSSCVWVMEAAIYLTYSQLEETVIAIRSETEKHGCDCFGWVFTPDYKAEASKAENWAGQQLNCYHNLPETPLEDELSIQICYKKSGKTIFIDGIELPEFATNGILARPHEISKYNAESLNCFSVIAVPFGDSYCKVNNLSVLGENVSAQFMFDEGESIIAQLFISDPDDIEASGKHLEYQKALVSAIKKKEHILLPDDFNVEDTEVVAIPDEIKAVFENSVFVEQKKNNCQFLIKLNPNKYSEVFTELNTLLEELDSEARANMQ